MELALHFMNFTLPGGSKALGPTLAATAQAAEESGCSTFTMMDHWFQMEGFATAQDPMLEGYTSLGFVAGKTERMTLSLMVTGVTYRHPGLLAKIVTTLDVVSGGGPCSGSGRPGTSGSIWRWACPSRLIAERFERLEETLQICNQMWSDNDGPYDGKHYHLAETLCHPHPCSSLARRSSSAAAASEDPQARGALRGRLQPLRARAPEVQRKLDILAQHCEAEGRDMATIKKTIQGGADPTKDLDGFFREMEEYAKLGIDMVGVRNTSPSTRSGPRQELAKVALEGSPRSVPRERQVVPPGNLGVLPRSYATAPRADDIPARDLRNDVSGVLRRVQAGERLRVTVSGRPVAELVPLARRPRSVRWQELMHRRRRLARRRSPDGRVEAARA